MMKKIILITFAVLVSTLAYSRGWNRSSDIDAKDLPSTSQKIISKYFGGLSNVDAVTKWPSNYGVYLKTGEKINFYLHGGIKQIKAKRKAIPHKVLSEFHKNISSYVQSKYSNWDLIELQVKRSKIELELEKGRLEAELEFSTSGELLDEDIDD